jgi:hypothetical protein
MVVIAANCDKTEEQSRSENQFQLLTRGGLAFRSEAEDASPNSALPIYLEIAENNWHVWIVNKTNTHDNANAVPYGVQFMKHIDSFVRDKSW